MATLSHLIVRATVVDYAQLKNFRKCIWRWPMFLTPNQALCRRQPQSPHVCVAFLVCTGNTVTFSRPLAINWHSQALKLFDVQCAVSRSAATRNCRLSLNQRLCLSEVCGWYFWAIPCWHGKTFCSYSVQTASYLFVYNWGGIFLWWKLMTEERLLLFFRL